MKSLNVESCINDNKMSFVYDKEKGILLIRTEDELVALDNKDIDKLIKLLND